MMIDSSTDDEDDEVVDHAPQRNGGPPGKQNGTPGNQKVPNGTSIPGPKLVVIHFFAN